MWTFSSPPKNVLGGPLPKDASSTSRPWALVTGANAGIGYSLAYELGKRDFNVIIHGRDGAKLKIAKEELEGSLTNGVEIRTLQLDANATFSLDGTISPADQAALDDMMALDLRVLVNNVGMGHNPVSDFEPLIQQPGAQVARILNTNIVFMTYLTRLLLPTLQKNAIGKLPGVVINCSSLAEIGLPWMAVYAGTKAYITVFSKALDSELKGDGHNVRVMASLIGDTDSPGHKVGTGMFCPSSEEMGRLVVESASASGQGQVALIPYRWHWVQWLACVLQPFWLLQLGTIENLKNVRKLKED